jgi:alpha-1,2-mannosyltransferase
LYALERLAVGEKSRVGRWLPAFLWLACGAVVLVRSWLSLTRPFGRRMDDLQVYAGSIDGLFAGGSLYDYRFPATGAPFTYPPFGGLALSPIALFDVYTLMVVWTVATIVAIASLVVLLDRQPGVHRHLPRGTSRPVLMLLFFASAPIASNLRYGQISFFVILAVLLDCLRVMPARFTGVATGIAAAVKLTPLIFVPYFWLSGQRRAAITATGTFVACTALAWLLLPSDSTLFWFTKIFDVDGMGAIEIGGNQSLNAALLRLDVPHSVREVLVAVVGGAIVLAALIRGARAWRNDQPLVAAGVVGAAGLVFSPVSWNHHQSWLLLAALVPVSARPLRNLAWASLVAALMILPVTSLDFLPGGIMFGNARLLLAIAVASVVPFVAVKVRANASRVPAG